MGYLSAQRGQHRPSLTAMKPERSASGLGTEGSWSVHFHVLRVGRRRWESTRRLQEPGGAARLVRVRVVQTAG